MKPRTDSRWQVALGILALVAACAGAPAPGSSTTLASEAAAAPVTRPRILSAHLRARSADPGHLHDEILVVFSEHVDAATLVADAFVVVRGDGRDVVPEAITLAPADEDDENRSVTLHGAFASAGAGEPVAVHVLGGVFAEGGATMRGTDAEVRKFSQPDTIVHAERQPPGASTCTGASQVLRTSWTDTLAGVGLEDRARIRLRLADGSEIHPAGFGDQHVGESVPALADPAPPPPDAEVDADVTVARVPEQLAKVREDNVLDLCVASGVPVVAIAVEAGTFVDEAGHASARAHVDLPLP